jgi:hypothetical protein
MGGCCKAEAIPEDAEGTRELTQSSSVTFHSCGPLEKEPLERLFACKH